MRGHGHDRAGAVTEQNIIRDPNRNALLIGRINRASAGKNAGFFFRKICALQLALARSPLAILAHRRPLFLCDDKIDK